MKPVGAGMVWAVALAMATADAKEAAALQPMAVTTTVRVEVGADGHVTGTVADDKLPSVVHEAVTRDARALRFRMPKEDGETSGVTFVKMRVCLAPVGGDLAIATQFLGNGPRAIDYPPPRYPPGAAMAGRGGDFKVRLQVGADGKPVLESIQGSSGAVVRHDFRESITQWVPRLRYEPELVSGKPVATRMEVPLSFVVSDNARSMAASMDPDRAQGSASDVCQRALRGQMPVPVAVALDSPFVLHIGSGAAADG